MKALSVITGFIRSTIAIGLVCSVICVPLPVRADEDKEYQVKAAMIAKFFDYLDWPDGKALSKQSHVDICVLGDTPLKKWGTVIKTVSASPSAVHKLDMSLVAENNLKNIPQHCHVVFIGKSESGRLSEINAALKGQPVLTVSDIDNFAESGGMIGFVIIDDGSIKLMVNTKSTNAAGMRVVNPQLLGIAIKVIDK